MQAEDGIRDRVRSRGLGDVYKRQHIDEAEMELVKAAGAKVMHQPRSNMNNGVGAARVLSLIHI